MTVDVMQPDDYTDPDLSLPRIVWTPESSDLHVNLVSLKVGESIGKHVNETLDVLLTCLAGAGELHIEDEVIALAPGTIVVIPKGTRRIIVASNNILRYTTCHRKRDGLMPSVRHRS